MKKTTFLILIIISLLLLVACFEKEDEKPEYTDPYSYANDYVQLWEKKNFQRMYDEYLGEDTKNQFNYGDFGERYQHLYDVLEIDNLSIELLETKEFTEEEYQTLKNHEIPISISFDTLAGNVDYQKTIELNKLIEEDEQAEMSEGEEIIDPESPWFIDWDPSFILPNLEVGDEVRLSTIPANRGEIVDRNGELLATQGEVYEVGVVLENFDEQTSLASLASVLDVSEKFIKSKYEQSWVQPQHFVPIKKFSLNDENTVSSASEIEGVSSQITVDRVYPYGKIAAHLTGYIGNITAEELEELEDQGYRSQDRLGKRGFEELFDKQLRGQDGQEIYIEKVDQSTHTVAKIEAKDGENVQTTIDIKEQEKLYNLFKDERGTASIINPKTGEIISLLSYPAFDPNQFILGQTSEEYSELINDESNPMLNRFATNYSPGSTMKVLSTIIGLNNNQIDPNEYKTIEGKQWQKDDSWGNYYVTRYYDQDTQVDLESAFEYSDNIYFAKLGIELGQQTFVSGLERLGFGETLPFEYPILSSQISNDGKLNNEVLLADTAYGQGQLMINIVHLVSLFGGVVNDGDAMKPLLLSNESQSTWIEDMITSENANLLQQLLRKVVSEGSSQNINISNKQIAGKTGTAELKSSQEEENGVENGIFVSYDQQNPERVIAAIVEGVEDYGGSKYVVEIVKKYYEQN